MRFRLLAINGKQHCRHSSRTNNGDHYTFTNTTAGSATSIWENEMNFVEATTSGINTGGHPAWVDFGDFSTMVILPSQGRTEANQLAYFNRTEIGCIYESEVSDEYPIVVPLPPNCLWDEIRVSMYGWHSTKIPAFTAEGPCVSTRMEFL